MRHNSNQVRVCFVCMLSTFLSLLLVSFQPHIFFSPNSRFFHRWSVVLLFSVVVVFVVPLLGYPVGHDAVVKAVFPPP